MIRITSTRHNFRRCGMPHPKGTVEYPDDRFSEDEMLVLKAEAVLIVEELSDSPKQKAAPVKKPVKRGK